MATIVVFAVLRAGSIYSLIKSIKRNDIIISLDDIQLYEKIYSKELRKRKFIYFIASSVLTAPVSSFLGFWLNPWDQSPELFGLE